MAATVPTTWSLGRGLRNPGSTRCRRQPTTSRCSPSPPARPAGPKSPCTSTATSWRSPTRSAGTSCVRSSRTCRHDSPVRVHVRPGGGAVFPLHAGAATFLIERATPDELADVVAEHGVTILFTAPTAYKAMVAAGRGGQLRGLRRAVSAGEHLPATTWQASPTPPACGSSRHRIDGDAAHLIAASDDDIRPGSTGRAYPGSSNGAGRERQEAPAGQEVGWLSAARQAADTSTTTATGVCPGRLERDRGHLCPRRGRVFWYRARSDDMIVSSGYNIAGPEVEQALLGHPDVVECAVVGAPDPDRGQVVKAYVVLRDGATPDDAARRALQDYVKATIAPLQVPTTARVPRRAAEDPDRQAAAVQAAPGVEAGRGGTVPAR